MYTEDLEERIRVLEGELNKSKQSERKYRSLFTLSPLGIVITEPSGKILEANTEWQNMTGFTEADCINISAADYYVNTEDRLAFLEKLANDGKVRGYETIFIRKDKSRIDVLLNSDIVDIEGKRVILTQALEVTEMKNIQEMLRRSEARYRAIIENTNDAIYVHDLKGNILDVNEHASVMTGYAKKELIGSNLAKIDPEFVDVVQDDFDDDADSEKQEGPSPVSKDLAMLFNDDVAVFERRNIRKDGEEIIVEVSARLISHDGEGMVTGFVRDITHRKHMERKNINMLSFLQTLIDTIPNPIFFKDTDGLYQDCNKEFENYVGLKKEEIIGKDAYSLVPGKMAQKYHDMDASLLCDPGRQTYEHQIIYADGSLHDVVVNKATYINTDGTLAGIVGVMMDITERKRVEEELAKYRDGLERLVEKRTMELEARTKKLEEFTIALQVLSEYRQKDKQEMEKMIVMNIKNQIIPLVGKLKTSHLNKQQLAYLSVLETSLKSIKSSMIKNIEQFNLTPTELEVALFIKEGNSTREIAEIMGIATSSIDTHRNSIRKKLNISRKSVNLQTYLKSFT